MHKQTQLLRNLALAGSFMLASGCSLANTPEGHGEFIETMVQEHGFQREALERLLGQAEKRQDILDAISRPAEGLPWWKYRRIFLTDKRIDGGVEFWKKNREALQKAEREYGVPAEIITAIIGVETFYGRQTGRYRVLDALSTLGFHYPKRGAFFRKQLGEFLLLARDEKIDPTKPLGSYAGAMGRPQFIPSSYRAYAVDFDGDGSRDIWGNDIDAIGSVANYFHHHGWRNGEAITERLKTDDAQISGFREKGMKPSIPQHQLREAGITLNNHLGDEALASLVELELSGGNEYWAGLHNFYVITRYNHSNLYAMAAYQLSQEIRKRYHE